MLSPVGVKNVKKYRFTHHITCVVYTRVIIVVCRININIYISVSACVHMCVCVCVLNVWRGVCRERCMYHTPPVRKRYKKLVQRTVMSKLEGEVAYMLYRYL